MGEFETTVREKLNPKITSSRYLINSFLRRCIKKIIKCKLEGEKNLKIVDIGCGTKPYFSLFESKSSWYVGIDIYAIKGITEITAVAEALPFRPRTFNLGLCLQTLEHVFDPQKTLYELQRVLKPGGLLVVSTHGVWNEGHDKNDFWRWTVFGLRHLIQSCGFCDADSFSMSPLTSLIQIIQLYIPDNWVSRNIVVPMLNVTTSLMNMLFKNRSFAKISVVHMLTSRNK